MEKVYLLLFFLVSILCVVPSTAQTNGNSLVLSKDGSVFSVTPASEHYETEFRSGSAITSKGKLYSFTFDSIANRIVDNWPDILAEDGLLVNLTYNGVRYVGFLSPEINSHQASYSAAISLFNRYSGAEFPGARVWPVDSSLAVLESFPEQYGVSSIIQRSPDLLTVVVEFKAFLFVWDKDDISEDLTNQRPLNLENAIHSEQVPSSIASGGGYTEVVFQTFSLGSELRPDDLVFAIVIDTSMAMLILSDPSYGLILNSTTIPNVSTTSQVNFLDPLISSLALIYLVIRKRKITQLW